VKIAPMLDQRGQQHGRAQPTRTGLLKMVRHPGLLMGVSPFGIQKHTPVSFPSDHLRPIRVINFTGRIWQTFENTQSLEI
jgi:hypothetical protein